MIFPDELMIVDRVREMASDGLIAGAQVICLEGARFSQHPKAGAMYTIDHIVGDVVVLSRFAEFSGERQHVPGKWRASRFRVCDIPPHGGTKRPTAG